MRLEWGEVGRTENAEGLLKKCGLYPKSTNKNKSNKNFKATNVCFTHSVFNNQRSPFSLKLGTLCFSF